MGLNPIANTCPLALHTKKGCQKGTIALPTIFVPRCFHGKLFRQAITSNASQNSSFKEVGAQKAKSRSPRSPSKCIKVSYGEVLPHKSRVVLPF
jgi:hypothetical protein